MKNLLKNNHIPVLFLFLAFMVSCDKHTKEEPREDCNDIVIYDEKLISPQWMVDVIDSLDRDAAERQVYNVYNVSLFEYKQQTYVVMQEMLNASSWNDVFYTCHGIYINDASFVRELGSAMEKEGVNYRTPFAAYCCYSNNCVVKSTTVRPFN
jgi:hypothetical protein